MQMSLSRDDLKAIKEIVDTSIDEKVKPMLDDLNFLLVKYFDMTQQQIFDLQDDMAQVKKDLKDIKVTVRQIQVRGTLA
jgi:hypothetical protein